MKGGMRRSAVIGFIVSIVLTFIAYGAVTGHWLSGTALVAVILALALTQLAVQMTCFLDLGFGASGARWRTLTFLATFGLVFIVVVGSVWIMWHLNYNMMASPSQMMKYIQSQQGF